MEQEGIAVTIFDGGRESWEAREQHPRERCVACMVWMGLAVLVLVAVVLVGCHQWPDLHPGGDGTPHGWLD